MSFNFTPPFSPVNATIPVTLGCGVSFSVNQVASGDPGVQVPINFDPGDSVYMSIEINRTQTASIDAILDGNAASFTIPTDVCDHVAQWSTWQAVKTAHDGLETPLCVGSFQRFDGK